MQIVSEFYSLFTYYPINLITDVWRNKSNDETSKSGQNRSTSKSYYTDSDSEAVSLLIERMGNLVIPVQSLFQLLSSKSGMISNKNAIGNKLT